LLKIIELWPQYAYRRRTWSPPKRRTKHNLIEIRISTTKLGQMKGSLQRSYGNACNQARSDLSLYCLCRCCS
jgi:hypothetical protein